MISLQIVEEIPNTTGGITLARNSASKNRILFRKGINSPVPTLAQEVYELELKRDRPSSKKVCLIFRKKIDLSKSFLREMEETSAHVQAIVANQIDPSVTIESIIKSRANDLFNFYNQFEGMTIQTIEKNIRNKESQARKWVAANQKRIDEWRKIDFNKIANHKI